MIGTTIGPYQILAELGRGGMGEVYRARDAKLNRDVALKILPSSVASDPDRLVRFRREAQVLAALNHPNIAQIYGFEDAGPIHALVMELVPGRTLAEIIASHVSRPTKGMPVAEALAIARQIADALETAHEQGIIHRDLKPANVKVRDDGTVKVLDFGLAKALDSGVNGPSDPTNSPTVTGGSTQPGVVLGTAAYMAPEQARGRAVDRRVDIWAFGVVLYEMLTGDRAFRGDDMSETLASVLRDTPPFDALPSDLPPRLRRLIADCLIRDPRQRLRDIGDARLTIERIIAGKDDDAVASATHPRSRVAVLAPWAVAAAALLGAAVVLWRSNQAPVEPPRVVMRSFQDLKETSAFVAVSRDGARAIYTEAGTGGYVLMRREMGEFESQRIPGTETALMPLLSPDGNWIAYEAGGQSVLRRIAVSGGTATTLCPGSFAWGGAWGDNDTIVFGGSNGLLRVPSTGGAAERLTTVDTAQGEGAHVRPQFLPGGRELLFTVTKATVGEPPQFAILDLKTGQYSLIAPGGDNGRYAPTGHLTYVKAATLFALPFDLAHRRVVGPEVPVVPNVSTAGPPGTGDYAFSDNGVLVYSQVTAGGGSTLAWTGRHGEVVPMPGQIGRDWGTGRLSPDGTRVINGIHDEKGRTDIWIIDLLRGTPTRLTFDGKYDSAMWMPDGTAVFGGIEAGAYGLYRIAISGSGKVERILATERRSTPLSSTPDGKTLVFSEVGSEAMSRLFVLPPAGAGGVRKPEPLHETSSDETQGEVSPDGKWIAYRSAETRSNEVYVHAFPKGDRVRISTNGGDRPRWAKQGRELLYWDNVAGNPTLMSVMIQTTPAFQPSVPKPLFRLSVGTWTWDVAPGGEKFLVEFLGPLSDKGVATSRLAIIANWFDELRVRAPAKKQ